MSGTDRPPPPPVPRRRAGWATHKMAVEKNEKNNVIIPNIWCSTNEYWIFVWLIDTGVLRVESETKRFFPQWDVEHRPVITCGLNFGNSQNKSITEQ